MGRLGRVFPQFVSATVSYHTLAKSPCSRMGVTTNWVGSSKGYDLPQSPAPIGQGNVRKFCFSCSVATMH